KYQFDKNVLNYVDFEDQKYQIISDENNEGVAPGTAWKKGPIPLEFAITGLGPNIIRIADFDFFKQMLEKVLKFEQTNQEEDHYLFEVGEGGNGAAVIVHHTPDLFPAQQGFGTVHHLAFRVNDREELDYWDERLKEFGFSTSGYVDRFFFESLYARV